MSTIFRLIDIRTGKVPSICDVFCIMWLTFNLNIYLKYCNDTNKANQKKIALKAYFNKARTDDFFPTEKT